MVPGVPLFPIPPPGRGPFASLTPRESSSLGLVALSLVAARLGVLTADRRYGKAREASRSCGAPGLTPTWSCPLVAELLESLSAQPSLPGRGTLQIQLPMLPIPRSGLFSGGAWLKVMSGCLPRLWAEPRSSVSPATPDRGCQVGVIAGQLPRSPDGSEHINTLGFWPVWRTFLKPDSLRESLKWPQACSRCLAELMDAFWLGTHPEQNILGRQQLMPFKCVLCVLPH